MAALEPSIAVRGLRKQYRLGARTGQRVLGEAITGALRGVLSSPSNEDESSIWALDDVSFDVARGEIVGVIGPNGAGKSTLLKILSRITEPTGGRAEIYGRVASLLEIGTGFHLDLTGRENVYFNGAILGMRKSEIDARFDEIVGFAGVEKFIDTPLKFFSSGMQVRLGFAVAAHLEPDILVVDEVLTVGDLAFQERCLGKMRDVSQGGRTVLFVSHNMAAILALCPRSLLLTNGRLVYDGPSEEAVSRYVEASRMVGGEWLADRNRPGSGAVRVTSLRLENADRELVVAASSGQDVHLVLDYVAEDDADLSELVVNVVIAQEGGRGLLSLMSQVASEGLLDVPRTGRVVCRVPELPLMPGHYNVQYSVLLGSELADKIHQAGSLVVTHGDFYGTGRLPPQEHYGPVLVRQAWSVETPSTAPPSAAAVSAQH